MGLAETTAQGKVEPGILFSLPSEDNLLPEHQVQSSIHL